MYVLIHSKYILGQFPPLLCVPKNGNLWYFSSVLVLNVLIAVGVCLFVPMFWIVHKVSILLVCFCQMCVIIRYRLLVQCFCQIHVITIRVLKIHHGRFQ